jgi:hypothetical protein
MLPVSRTTSRLLLKQFLKEEPTLKFRFKETNEKILLIIDLTFNEKTLTQI